MFTIRIFLYRRHCLAVALAIVLTALLLGAAPPRASAPPGGPMKLTHACLIAQRLATMRDFYARILKSEPKVFGEDYLEFHGSGAIFSLWSQEGAEKIAPGAMVAGANRSILLEFEVADVDQEYQRLKQQLPDLQWVMPPTTFPWGHRTIYFRDPEGNLINFYSVVQTP